MDNNIHECGPLVTKYGSLYSLSGHMIESPAIIIDIIVAQLSRQKSKIFIMN